MIRGYDYKISSELESELVAVSYSPKVVSSSEGEASSFNSVTEDEEKIIERAANIPASTWYALSKWAKETNNFQGWQRSIVFSVGQLIARGKKPSLKQSVQALKVYDEAESKGYRPE